MLSLLQIPTPAISTTLATNHYPLRSRKNASLDLVISLLKISMSSMSSTSCFFHVLLLCLFLHACNARPLITSADHENLERKSLIPNMSYEKEIPVAPRVESIAKLQDSNSTHQKLKGSKENIKQKAMIDHRTLIDTRKVGYNREGKMDHDKQQSFVSVSWRVPQKKRGEKHPGFNLDYSPPKTHPPSHN